MSILKPIAQHPNKVNQANGDGHKNKPETQNLRQPNGDVFIEQEICPSFLEYEEGNSKFNYLKSIQIPSQNNNVLFYDVNNNTADDSGLHSPVTEMDDPGNGGDQPYPYTNLSPSTSLPRSGSLRLIIFNNLRIRQRFLRQVLTVLTIQLLIVILWTLLCFNVKKLGDFIEKHYWYAVLAIVVYLSLYFLVAFASKLGRKFPFNFIILALYTITLAYLCSYVSLQYTTSILILGMGTTILLCIALMLVTKCTSLDVTGWGIYLTLAGSFVMLYAFSVLICSYLLDEKNEAMNILHITGAFLGAGVVSVYFLYDIQMIIGGRRVEISPDEWLYASMTIFYDIVLFFVYIVSLFGLKCITRHRHEARRPPTPVTAEVQVPVHMGP